MFAVVMIATVAIFVLGAISMVQQNTGGGYYEPPSSSPPPPVADTPSDSEQGGHMQGDMKPKVVGMSIGDRWDEKTATITQKRDTFPAGTRVIYVTAKVLWQGNLGGLVGTLEPADSLTAERAGRRQLAIALPVTRPGGEDIYLMKFTAPDERWAPGRYQIVLSTGELDLETRIVTMH